MFSLLDLSEESSCICLRCDPKRAVKLRELTPEVTPSYHYNVICIILFVSENRFERDYHITGI